MQYSYEHWIQEQMHSSNNGGFTNLASGRITKTMYDNLHGVIVCNVRRNDITRNSELKVQISLTSMEQVLFMTLTLLNLQVLLFLLQIRSQLAAKIVSCFVLCQESAQANLMAALSALLNLEITPQN